MELLVRNIGLEKKGKKEKILVGIKPGGRSLLCVVSGCSYDTTCSVVPRVPVHCIDVCHSEILLYPLFYTWFALAWVSLVASC